MKRVWKAGIEVPLLTRREEKVFVAVMQRARTCLFDYFVSQLYSGRKEVNVEGNQTR